MKNFVTLKVNKEVKFPIANYVAYDHLSKTCQSFVAATSTITELTTYEKLIKIQGGKRPCKLKLMLLQSDKT